MKKSLSLLLVAAFSVSSLTVLNGCKKEGCTDPNAVNYDTDAKEDDGSCVYSASVMLTFNSKVGSDNLIYNTDYMINGRKTRFTRVQFYASGFVFNKATGGTVTLDDEYLLVEPGQTDYALVNGLAHGDYSGFKFYQGVDPDVNTKKAPSDWPAGHALSPSDNPNHQHWGWNSGYVFVVLEGRVDTTAAANGDADYSFVFHAGTDDLLRTINLQSDFTAVDGETVSLAVDVDWAEYFHGLDLREENETHTMNDKPTATTIVNNGERVFSAQ